MSEDPQVAAAKLDVERKRARVMATAHSLQERLSPGVLARGAWEGAKDKGANLAEEAVDAVRARPLAATGVVAAITTPTASATMAASAKMNATTNNAAGTTSALALALAIALARPSSAWA